MKKDPQTLNDFIEIFRLIYPIAYSRYAYRSFDTIQQPNCYACGYITIQNILNAIFGKHLDTNLNDILVALIAISYMIIDAIDAS
eukprot:Pgem_evm2s933